MKHSYHFFSGWLGIVLLTGCNTVELASPIDVPSAALDMAADDADSDPLFQRTENVPEDWWNLFQDEQLTAFIEKAFDLNPTLQEAQANIYLAAYNADRLRAVLFPNIILGADVAREKLSETGLIPFKSSATGSTGGSGPTGPTSGFATPAGADGIPVYFTQYETELILTYDFDLWGKNRNTLAAAVGEMQAKVADDAFTRLQLGIAVAQTYFKLQTEYKRLEIARALAGASEQYLELIKKLVTGSLADVMTLHNAELSWTATKQAVIQIEGSIAVDEYQLKTYLAGNFEELIENTHIIDQPLPQVPLPRDLPLHLIANRPDISSQLWLIESAGKQIEVAQAGFYPDFNISALYGYQTIHFREWFKQPSSFFNVDPAFTLPIFDGGRLLANLRGSEVNYNLAIYQYNEMVLNAAKEVLDEIAVLRNNEQQEQEADRYLEYQEKNYQIVEKRIHNHLSSGLDYIDSLQKVLQAQDQQTVARGNTIQAILSLIKALGGGYEACIEE